jgi:hypothetical protein
MSDKCVKNWLYVVIIFTATLLYVFFVLLQKRRATPGEDNKQKVLDDRQDKVLAGNAQLIAAAFALVVTVTLVIAQLAASLGIGRSVRPQRSALFPELIVYGLAISFTLVGLWHKPGGLRNLFTHVSSWLTLTGLLVLIPYFWYARQQISTRVVIVDALSIRNAHATRPDCAILDVLQGAAMKGDYLLFRDGVDTLRRRAANDSVCRMYLVQLEQYLARDGGNQHALEIVTSALGQLSMGMEKRYLPLPGPTR